MDSGLIVTIILSAIGILNVWTLTLYSGIRTDIKLVTDKANDANKKVAVLEAQILSISSDIKDMKNDLHTSSSAVLESFKTLDTRLHEYIIQQVGRKND